MPVSRRHFLLGSLAAAGFAAVEVGAGDSVASASPTVPVDKHEFFADASRSYKVPATVLAATSYSLTRWSDHAGKPSTSLGYGPMHLVDGAAAAQARQRSGKTDSQVIDTLGRAARLTGISKDQLKSDPRSNIAGAAAVIADVQRARGGATGSGTNPGDWFAAVGETSGLVMATSQEKFAQHVMTTISRGASVSLPGGETLLLKAAGVTVSQKQRKIFVERAEEARAATDKKFIDAPEGLHVEWIAAPYEQYGEKLSQYGNHDLAYRPKTPKLTHLVIHDTEGSYNRTIEHILDPTWVSWQYTIRSSDGHVAQHLEPKDVAWHCGNWYLNTHSFGIEHEGKAAQGARWYTDVMYRHSAELVKYLTSKYGIKRTRGTIIGHDQVPAEKNEKIPSMHWDPGPFWDWERFFTLIDAPLDRGTVKRLPRPGEVVRILPGFHGNAQPIRGCVEANVECDVDYANFVTVRTQPDAGAPIVNDVGLHQKGQPATHDMSDISGRATAGVDFVVADVRGDWTAIWFVGNKGWFYNPASSPTARVVPGAKKVKPRGDKLTVYGNCRPEASAFPTPEDVQPQMPLLYDVPSDQSYAVLVEEPLTDYYKAKSYSIDTPDDHVLFSGSEKFIQISFGHRFVFVKRDDVTVS